MEFEGGTLHAFATVEACWICGGRNLRPVARAIFEFSA